VSEKNLWKHDKKGEVWWGKDGNNSPRIKEHLEDAKDGVVPSTWWTYRYAGTNSGAKVALRRMLGDQEMFVTPKPVELVRRILELAADKNSIVMDAFAGSGTTAHAVLEQNQTDGGSRRFVLVEMDERIGRDITVARVSRAILGYSYVDNKGNKHSVQGLGSGFRFCELGEALFDSAGRVASQVSFADLAQHIFFTETGQPLSERPNHALSPVIGMFKGAAYYLLFNGILGDKRPEGGNILTSSILQELPTHSGPRIVFGEGCRIGINRLKREQVVFKQIPYEIKVY
jgi:site-specific DNA-methyltransferase (adenine-specific)/adenine-specific DNA-methyltransferase